MADANEAEGLRQAAIDERERLRRLQGMDPTTAAILSAWESKSGTEPATITAQQPAGPSLGDKIDQQRRVALDLPAQTSAPAVNLEDVKAFERRGKQVGNFPVAPGGAPFAQRIETGIKKTELGQFNNLVANYGDKNVSELYGNDGKTVVGFAVRNAPDQPWHNFDPPVDATDENAPILAHNIKGLPEDKHGGGIVGFFRSLWSDLPGDIADVAGPAVLEAGPGAVLSAAGGAIGGIPGAMALGGIGDAAGSVARDAVAERLPGAEDSNQSKNATGRDTAINVVAGAAANALPLFGRVFSTPTRKIAANVAKESAFDPLTHAAITAAAEDAQGAAAHGAAGAADEIASATARRPVSEIIPERAALSQRTAVDLSAGQLTGSRDLLMKEDALSAVGKYANEIGDAQMKRVRQGEVFLRKTLVNRPDTLTAGENGVAAYLNYTKQVDKARGLGTRPLFVEADQLLGGRRLSTRNFRSAAEALVAKDGAGSSSGTKAISSRAAQIIKELDQNPNVSASRLSDLLSEWGQAAHGGDLEAFKEADPRRARAAAAKLFGGLQADLDEAARIGPAVDGKPRFNSSSAPYGHERTGDLQAAAAKLRDARERFKELSVPIDDAKNALLENMVPLRDARKADTIGASLLQTKSENQIRHAVGVMSKADPVAARDLVVDALGSLVDAAKAGTGEANQAGVSVSMARFATSGRTNRGKVLALVSGLGDTQEAKSIMSMWNDAVDVAQIISDRGLPPGSPTAPRLFNAAEETSSVIKDAKSGGIAGAAAGVVDRTFKKGPVLNGQKLATMAADPEARDGFLSLVKQMSTAGGRLKAEAKSPRAHAEAWFRAAIQTGIIEMRDASLGGANADTIEAQRRRNRPSMVDPQPGYANEGAYQ